MGKRAYWIASLSLAMTGRCIDGVVRQADVLLDCFAVARNDGGVVMAGVASGRGKRTFWIASRFRALTLAMT